MEHQHKSREVQCKGGILFLIPRHKYWQERSFLCLTANFRCIAWWSTEIPSSQTLSRSPSFAYFLLPIGFLCCNTRIFIEVAFTYRVTWLQVCVCDWGISGFSLCQFLLVIWDICPLLSWWLRPGLAYSFGHTK